MGIDNSEYYSSGNLSIESYIYGEPDIQYLLVCDEYLNSGRTRIVASSYDKSEIEALKLTLES